MDIAKKITDRALHYFTEICAIPRGSGNEAAVAAYLVKFANSLADRDVTVYYQTEKSCASQTDVSGGKPIHNVIIKKPATRGYENSPSVALQSHIDIVCAKDDNETFDFLNDPIIPVIIGDEMRAQKRTTLGADDGIGVACMLAILESAELRHPQIEAIFTSDEEAGMSGANALDMSKISATQLINLDAEEEGKLYYGCAGGTVANITIPITKLAPPANIEYYKITISGLKGGHSGMMIHKKRANANRLMGRILYHLKNELSSDNADFFLVDIFGGGVRNAIPNRCAATVAVAKTTEKKFETLIDTTKQIFTNEYKYVEDTLTVTAEKITPSCANVIDDDAFDRMITAVMTLPNDVIAMFGKEDDVDLVETSSNMGIVECNDCAVTISCFARSCVASKLDMVTDQMRLIAKSIGAKFSILPGAYSEWQPNLDSKLKKLFETAYKELFNKNAETLSIHAGLECGHFAKVRPEMDMIALGPTVHNVHTPDETLYVSTVEPVVRLLIAVLAKL